MLISDYSYLVDKCEGNDEEGYLSFVLAASSDSVSGQTNFDIGVFGSFIT